MKVEAGDHMAHAKTGNQNIVDELVGGERGDQGLDLAPALAEFRAGRLAGIEPPVEKKASRISAARWNSPALVGS